MKKTAATMALLAGFGGGCTSTDNAAKPAASQAPTGGFGTVTRGQQVPGLVGPNGEPIMAARAAMPAGGSSGVVNAGGTTASSGGIQQAGLFSTSDCGNCAYVPGGTPLFSGEHMAKFYAAANGYTSGVPGTGGGPPTPDNRGIFPVPSMGPPGAVAAVGALPLAGRPGAVIGRTSVRFTGPAGMKVTWQLPNGTFNDEANGLTAPKEYNFLQAQTYRLRLTQILPNFPGKAFYPTLEVAAANPKSLTYLAHNSVPLTFTNEDFEQARAGNMVVKVIYLPDADNQDFAVLAGAEEVLSTRLEPGANPVAEAQRKGTILAIVRLGNIDLENRISPSMTSPPPSMMVPMMPKAAPTILPPPPQTVPGTLPPMPGGPTPPPKPMSSFSSTPIGSDSSKNPDAAKGSEAGSAKGSSTPLVPSVPKSAPTPILGDGSGSGLPTTLPPLITNGPAGK